MKVLNYISLALFLLVLCFVSVSAQENKRKVLKYSAPKYPPAALAVRASGTVIVTVKIDKNGKVASATADSGHPLLRKACENAAKEWLFSNDPAIGEQEIKITFLLRVGDKNKKDKLKFRKPYTLVIVAAGVIILNTTDYLMPK